MKRNPRIKKNPKRAPLTKMQKARLRNRGQKRFTKTMKRRMKANPANPATKYIHLQEKRGMGWVTIAMFPLSQKAVAVKIAKQWHRKHPGKALRLFS